MEVKPLTALLCDDVREERNGKSIYIGVYSGSVNLMGPVPEGHEGVVNFEAYLVIFCGAKGHGQEQLRVRITGPSGKVYEIDATIVKPDVSAEGDAPPMVIGPLQFGIWQNGEFKIECEDKRTKKWRLIKAIPVSFKKV